MARSVRKVWRIVALPPPRTYPSTKKPGRGLPRGVDRTPDGYKESGRWGDGNQFRVRVNCWRKLAEGVASSITVGDPVVVAGRLYTRDWTDAEGNLRTTYEMEAMSVGHDLSRGRGRFFRNKPTAATSAVETAEAEGQIRGEAATPVPEEEAPALYGDGILDGDEPTFADVPTTSPGGFDPVAALRGGTLEPFDTSIGMPSSPAADSASRGGSGMGEHRAEEPEPETAVETIGAETGTRRGRGRGSRRQPVPA